MRDFCPDGYLPIQQAVIEAAKRWFPEPFDELNERQHAIETREGATTNTLGDLARAFGGPSLVDAAVNAAIIDALRCSVDRLRNCLHQGSVTAYYFDDLFRPGRRAVDREFWATSSADGVLNDGHYWPFGRRKLTSGEDPHKFRFPLFVDERKFMALFDEPSAKKKPFPNNMKPALVEAIKKHNHLPNREAIQKAIRELPSFRSFRITEQIWRQAEKQVPRSPGVKKRGT